MDKVLSTRLSPDAIATLEAASRRLGMTKKRFLEEAIQLRAEQPEEDEVARQKRIADFEAALDAAFGSWVRDEPPEETIRQIKESWEQDWNRSWKAVEEEVRRRAEDLR